MLYSIEKAWKYGELVDVMYMAKDGTISKRRLRILAIHGKTFVAHCFLRNSKRTFLMDHVLAIVPVITREPVII